MGKRTVYFDYLRVLAAFAVIVLHVSAQKWGMADVNSGAWTAFTFYNSISRWGVPVFVMISGFLFLSREVSMKKILRKNFLRMFTAYLFWCFVYFLFDGDSVKGQILSLVRSGKADVLAVIFTGHFHLWFVPMIAGLYLCIPILKQIVKDEKTGKYFLLLWLLFAFICPNIKATIDLLLNERYALVFDAFYINNIGKLCMGLVLGFSGYFVLGFYLGKIEFSEKRKRQVLMMGIAGFALTIVLTVLFSLKTQAPAEDYLGNFTLNVLMEAVGMFVLFKSLPFRPSRLDSMVQKISKWSFGAYLVHALLIELLDRIWGINTLSFCTVISVPVIALGIFVCAIAISALLNSIPGVNKYLV